MKKGILILIVISLIIISCKQSDNKTIKKSNINSFSTNKDSAFYYSNTSTWASILRCTPTEVKKRISDNLNDTTYEFVAQMFLSVTNGFPKIYNLTTIKFNIKDDFLIYNLTTPKFQFNNKNIQLLKIERTFLIDHKDFNPIDTVFERIKSCDFWNLNSEINEEGDDGEDYCIIIKYKDKLHYVLRWSPDYGKDNKLFPKRKEYLKLIDLFNRLGFYGYYQNDLKRNTHLLKKLLK